MAAEAKNLFPASQFRRYLGPGVLSAALLATTFSALPAAASARLAPRNGGTLVVAAMGDVLTLDPMLTTDEYSKSVEQLLYNSLVHVSASSTVAPDLATGWTIGDSGKTYTFFLRHGVTFHHGGTMTSADVKYSFERLMDPKLASPWASFFAPVKSIDTPSTYTVVIHLSQPYAPFLAVVASFVSIMPQGFVQAQANNMTRVEDGTGPYELSVWKPGDEIVLQKNSHYFIAGEPHFSQVTFKVIPSDPSRLAALQSGQAQFAWFVDPTWGAQVTSLAKQGRIRDVRGLSDEYHMFGFNCKWGPFKNPLVRLALSYAVNRQQVLDAAARGQGLVSGLLTPALKYWALPVSAYPSYKPSVSAARKLLARAGYPHGFTFHIMAPSSFPVDMSDALIVQQQLKAIGVHAIVDPTEWGTYVHTWVKKSFESFTGENGDWTDPDLAMDAALTTGGSTNAFQFSDPKVDQLLNLGRTTTNSAARKSIYNKVQKLAVSEAPMLYFYATNEYMAMAPNVAGYQFIPGNEFYSLQSAYYTK